jgi:hypothetical protein
MEISRREGEDFSRDFGRSWQQILCGDHYKWMEKRAAGVGRAYTWRLAGFHVPGLCHLLGLPKVDQEGRDNFKAHWTKPGLVCPA